MKMDERQIRPVVLAALKLVAPEVEEETLDSRKPLRSQVDLDSMDWLNFLVAIHERLRVEIPESDYAKLTTLDGIVAYLAAKLSSAPSGTERG